MHRWPSTFPLPNEDFSVDGADNSFRTQMDSGSYRQRRRYTVAQAQIDVSVSLDDFQLAWFRAFHAFQLSAGVDWFIMPVPVGGAIADRQVRLIGGKFSVGYESVGFWRVSAKLDIKDEPVMSSATSAALLAFGGSTEDQGELVAQAAELHQCVHTVIPTNLN
jgi:hypothetical protein